MKHYAMGMSALVLVAGLGCGYKTPTQPGTGSVATTFKATLTGAAEWPSPVTTTATGTATITINDNAQTITFLVSVINLMSPTQAHIHVGGPEVAGTIAANLLPAAPAPGLFNGTLSSGTLLAANITGGETFASLVARIRSGQAYVNVHTVAHPGGEIRGQLAAQSSPPGY